jgi:hypothetical protein
MAKAIISRIIDKTFFLFSIVYFPQFLETSDFPLVVIIHSKNKRGKISPIGIA